MKLEIKGRWNGSVLFSMETESWKACVEAAVKSRADLMGADLTGAVLRGAVLRGAVLRGADLRGAVLRGADLRDAVLTGAVLRGADLRDADLMGAVLRGADLRGAVLTGADLRDAVLTGAVLRGADLRDADLRGAVLMGAVLMGAVLRGAVLTGVPVVPNLHQEILAALDNGGELDMSKWHTCKTTHCRAGWAVTIAGEAGKALEDKIGPAAAGALITLASCPWMERVPDFYVDNDAAMADIKACAQEEKEHAQG